MSTMPYSMDNSDYWVLDINARCLFVHREPIVDNTQPFAHRYRHVQTIDSEGQAAPLEKPSAIVPVAAMLMPAE